MGDDDNVIRVDFAGRAPRAARRPVVAASAPVASAAMADPLDGLYAVGDVARLFSLAPSRLRYWERTGFLARTGAVGGKRYYTFQDLIALRAAKELIDDGVPVRAVRRALAALRESLPSVARPLGALRIVAEGARIVVRDEHGSYEPESGQRRLDFGTSDLRDDVVRVLRPRGAPNDSRMAYDAYLEGCRLDEDERTFDAAEAAYRRAIDLDPTLANAFTNLGNILVRRGRSDEAERMYARALQVDTDQPEAFYNLGFLLYDRGDLAAAVLNFERALRSDPSFADAHFNLAMALTDLGRHADARRHWRTYLELDPESPWAEVARREMRR